jgi:hypothetical protein
MAKDKQLRIIKKLLMFFMIALFLSGLTAIPIGTELAFLLGFFRSDSIIFLWVNKVLIAYTKVKSEYPFILYGYDWLAFAHFIITILFIGPYKDPLKNIWVIQFGLIACILIIPLAGIAGYFRGIPIGWQLIDCSFGIIGFIPLWICYKLTKNLQLKISNL